MIIRKYTEKDISEMIHIWNEVVEDGEAFPQEEFWMIRQGQNSLQHRLIAVLQITTGKLLGSTSCIRITSATVATLQMQVMQWIQLAVESISVRNS